MSNQIDRSRPEINAVISARILAFVVNGGMTMQQAFNHVLGPAQYECLVEELYYGNYILDSRNGFG